MADVRIKFTDEQEKRIEKLEAQVKQLLARVFELEKGKEASIGPNVPTDGG